MTSIVTPEPKTAAQSPSTGDSRASSSDTPPTESASKSKSKSKSKVQSKAKSKSKARAGTEDNNVRKLRAAAMMSKAELARRAGVSPLTIDRVEAGCPCRMDTKRKILPPIIFN